MSFTNAYDQIRTELATLFSSYNELDNPYDLERNPDLHLRESYGITIGSGENTTKVLCSRADISRIFGIVLCRRMNATRNDTATRITAEKALFEDLTDIIKVFEEPVANITQGRYVSDDGVEFLDGDRYNYLILRSSFLIEYSESL